MADESSLSSAPVNTGASAAPVKQEAVEQGRWTAVTPDGSMRVEGDLVFMPLDELIDSDDPRYTKEFQGRARDTVSSQLQIERMSDNIDETRLNGLRDNRSRSPNGDRRCYDYIWQWPC